VWDIPEDWEVAVARADKKAGRTGPRGNTTISTGEKKERKKWTKKKKKEEEGW
jgi:hypothetical protein